jgi:hypothetical protein
MTPKNFGSNFSQKKVSNSVKAEVNFAHDIFFSPGKRLIAKKI